MTRRERVYASIRRNPLDAIPWQFDMTSVVVERLQRHLGVHDVRAALDDHFVQTELVELTRNDGAPVPPNCRRDAFGAVWRKDSVDRNAGDWGGLVSVPLSEPSLAGYRFPDPLADPDRTRLVSMARQENPDRFVWVKTGGLFERGWALCGFENYLGHIAGEEAFVEQVTERLADYCCQEVGLLRGLGIDAVRFGDDWGFQQTLIIQPSVWRRIYKPRYQRIFQAAHDCGLVVMMHSCGRLEDIIGDLIEIGLDVLHPLQPEANDVVRCQRDFGRHLTFWGGLGSQSTLPCGTPEQVRQEVRDRLGLFHGGGYVLAPAGAAPPETPVENILAMAAEARTQLAGRSV